MLLTSLVEELRFGAVFPELAGARVMISGVSSSFGVDISRAFAEHHARLLLQMSETSIEMDEVTAMLAQSAGGLKVYDGQLQKADEAADFARGPAQHAFGGLDVLINLITLTPGDLVSTGALEEVEALVSQKLLAPTLMSRIVANRMRLTWTQGLILNVLSTPPVKDARDAALASFFGATLATISRKEAEKWAHEGIRINAVSHARATPPLSESRDHASQIHAGRNTASEPELAALALYLASQRGASFSGQVFDTALVEI